MRAASAVATVQPFERVDLGRGGRGEVVHQPHRVEAGRLRRERAFEDAIERHPELRQVDAKPRIAHRTADASVSRPMELSGRGAIVTGGASGIGAATVAAAAGRRRARRGARPAATRPTPTCRCGATSATRTQVVAGVRDAVEQLGGLDVAIVNAGIGGMSPILDLSTDEWDRVMRVNLRGGVRDAARVRAGDGRARTAGRDRRRHERVGVPHRPVDGALLGLEGRASPRWCGSRRASSGRTASGSTGSRPAPPTRRCSRRPTRCAATASGSRAGPRSAGSGPPAEVAQAIVALCTLDWVTGPDRRGRRRRVAREPDRPDGLDRRRIRPREPCEIDAVVFDFDGLILDTELPDLHRRGARRSRRTAPRRPRSRSGRRRSAPSDGSTHRGVARRAGAGRRSISTRCTRRAVAHRDELLAAEAVRPGVEAWLAEADAAGLRPRDRVELRRTTGCVGHLDRLGLRERFAHVVTAGDDGSRASPRPTPISPRARRSASSRATRSRSRTRRTGSRPPRPRGCAASRCRTSLTETLDLSAADLRLDSLADVLARRRDRAPRSANRRISSVRPRARCPATGRAPTPSRPGRTPTRPTAARRRDRAGPRATR